MLANSMYFGLKKKSYRILKSWFHMEMLSLIVHFFVCSILKACFVVNDAIEGISFPVKALMLIVIDLSFLVEATMFCGIIWKVKDFANDEERPRAPETGENAAVRLPAGDENNHSENQTGQSSCVDMAEAAEESGNRGDGTDHDSKLPTYEECINNPPEAAGPPSYDDVTALV